MKETAGELAALSERAELAVLRRNKIEEFARRQEITGRG